MNSDAERWNARYATQREPGSPAPFLLEVAPELPASGRALDLAGGDGRHAIALARRGLTVTLCDVASAGLAIAARGAAQAGVALTCVERDLERTPPPPGPWDVIVCSYFLSRPLLRAIPGLLAPGGWFVFWHPTRRNLERHPRPSERFVLEDGELPSRVAGLEVVRCDERWWPSGRHEVRYVGRRSPHAGPPAAPMGE